MVETRDETVVPGLIVCVVRPGSVVVVRENRLVEQPNRALHQFRTEAATAVRRARLTPEEAVTVWALLLATEGWSTVAEWVRLRLNHH